MKSIEGGEAAFVLLTGAALWAATKSGGNHVAPHDGQDRYHEHCCRAVVHSCFPPSLDERNKNATPTNSCFV